MNSRKNIFYFDTNEKFASFHLSRALRDLISRDFSESNQFVVLCIGSDRVTGDSLGPLIGYKLGRLPLSCIHVYGTLESPVHALNLEDTITLIHSRHPGLPILAIDASLGSSKHLGYITAGKGCVHPGSGVAKELPAVGDIFITGIVNTAGFLDQMLLQTTRLSIVMTIADCITEAIRFAFIEKSQKCKKKLPRKRDSSGYLLNQPEYYV